MVQLKVTAAFLLLGIFLFQFQMVQLKVNSPPLLIARLQISIPNGSIKRAGSRLPIDWSISFQFQMVQLKVLPRLTSSMSGEWISIPNGSIKSPPRTSPRCPLLQFQFQMVQLKAPLAPGTPWSPLFQFQMVQLKEGRIIEFASNADFNSKWFN